MTASIEAIFEDGVFRPLNPFSAADGTRVHLQVETDDSPSTKEVLDLAASVYEGLSPEEVAEIEKHIQRRPSFFDDRSKP